MKTVNVQERFRQVKGEPRRCPVLDTPFTETGPGQPVILNCNHPVSTKGLEKLLGQEGEGRRCPSCQHQLAEGAKVSDFMVAPHILHDIRYPDKGFPADGPMPAARGNAQITPRQALQSVDHSGMFSKKGELKHLGNPIKQQRVIDDRPDEALLSNARFVRPYDFTRDRREQLMEAAKAHPDSIPYQQLRPGDLVVSKSPKELQQEATLGFQRFQMDRIFSLGDVSVPRSTIVPSPVPGPSTSAVPEASAVAPSGAATAAAVAGGAYANAEIEQLMGQLNWTSELVSMQDIQQARTQAEEAYEALCQRTGRTHEHLQIDYLEAALERTLEIAGSEDGLKLVKALDRVRADGRSSRLFVVTGVDQQTYKAEVRRVRLGNLRRLQPLRNAWNMRQRRGGATKGAVESPVDKEMEKLGAESDHMKSLGKLLFGYNRDEGWVEALLSEEDDAAVKEDLDSDAGALGWRIYDPEEGLSDEDEDD